ncbi:MAG: glycosyltransferase family 39 protein [Planctomycetaceae bacterium]
MVAAEVVSDDERGRRIRGWTFWSVVVLHVVLLVRGAAIHSPTFDEIAHLPAGISHWTLGDMILYRVNPPLPRMLAALPVLFVGAEVDWQSIERGPQGRGDFQVGSDFITANGERAYTLYFLGRLPGILFSIIGALGCRAVGTRLFGPGVGLAAGVIWCFSPDILAHAQLITPDVPATAMGIVVTAAALRWLSTGRHLDAALCGYLMGMALLCKTTWILWLGFLPGLWIVAESLGLSAKAPWTRRVFQLLLANVLAIVVLNMGYGFDGTGKSLGDYRFISQSLRGPENEESIGNRFEESWMAKIPVPLPEQFVQGIDYQKLEFESNKLSYLRGDIRRGGWWYYYLYAALVKQPVGLWLMFFAGFAATWWKGQWRSALLLLLPGALLFVLVSSQTGINKHSRYALPSFPFFFLIAATSVQLWWSHRAWVRWIPCVGGVAMAVSVLWQEPHFLGYFNELAGGPKVGHRHLINSNIDWGQDTLLLRKWYDAHPEAKEMKIALWPSIDSYQAGLPLSPPNPGPNCKLSRYNEEIETGPVPGWYALSVNLIHGYPFSVQTHGHGRIGAPQNCFSYFRYFEPVDRIGNSIWIYSLDREDVNRVRHELGLTLVTVADRP